MYFNNVSVRIPEGEETHSGYVKMRHKIQYSIVLRNDWADRCDATVEIDGQEIGTFRLEPYSSFRLERPPHDDGKFTFFRSGSEEAKLSNRDAIDREDRGLVRVTFLPEKHVVSNIPMAAAGDDWSYTGTSDATYACSTYYSSSLGEGITGLSGKSDQQFITVSSLDYDYSRITTITLRLVEDKSVDARPVSKNQTPYPPPVK